MNNVIIKNITKFKHTFGINLPNTRKFRQLLGKEVEHSVLKIGVSNSLECCTSLLKCAEADDVNTSILTLLEKLPTTYAPLKCFKIHYKIVISKMLIDISKNIIFLLRTTKGNNPQCSKQSLLSKPQLPW